MYSITTCDPTPYDPEHPDAQPLPIKHKEVAKGISRATIKNKPRHRTYREKYKEGPHQRLPNRAIRLKLHKVYLIKVDKSGLHRYDDKRYLLDNLDNGWPNPNTHAYGHYSIPATDTLLNSPDAGQGFVICVRPLRDSIDKCNNRTY